MIEDDEIYARLSDKNFKCVNNIALNFIFRWVFEEILGRWNCEHFTGSAG